MVGIDVFDTPDAPHPLIYIGLLVSISLKCAAYSADDTCRLLTPQASLDSRAQQALRAKREQRFIHGITAGSTCHAMTYAHYSISYSGIGTAVPARERADIYAAASLPIQSAVLSARHGRRKCLRRTYLTTASKRHQ